MYILNHDLLDSSPMFEDGTVPRCTKPDRSQLVKELEKHIENNKYDFQSDCSLETSVILDFLSKIRRYPNQAIQVTLSAPKNVFQAQKVHVVFDSYCELSVKKGSESVVQQIQAAQLMLLIYLSQSPYHSKLRNFGQALKPKTVFRFCPGIVLRDVDSVVASGMVVNGEVQSAKAQINRRSEIEVSALAGRG